MELTGAIHQLKKFALSVLIQTPTPRSIVGSTGIGNVYRSVMC